MPARAESPSTQTAPSLTMTWTLTSLAAPSPLISAITHKHKRTGTYQTEQEVMLPPPGKPCHFLDRKEDEADPCGVTLHPDRPFTYDDMDAYLPGSLLHPNAPTTATTFPII